MTTIAITHEEIAADSYGFTDGIRSSVNKQKIKVVGHNIYAFCGNSQAFGAAIGWHRNNANPEDVPKYGDWNLIVITCDGAFFCSQDMPFLERMELPNAFGSGERYALGAMDSGMSARDAVRAAMVRDPMTGGEVQVVRFADVFASGLVEAAE